MRDESGPAHGLVCTERERAKAGSRNHKDDCATDYIDWQCDEEKRRGEVKSRNIYTPTVVIQDKVNDPYNGNTRGHDGTYSPKNLLGLRREVVEPSDTMDSTKDDGDN